MTVWYRDKPSRTYAQSRAWSDAFSFPLRQTIGQVLVVPADVIQDLRENTDYWFAVESRQIAARVRNLYDYWNRSEGIQWGDEFTLRSARPGGTKTELEKILEGKGQVFVYAWGDASLATPLPAYTFIDLNKFRFWVNKILMPGLHHPWFQADPPWHVRQNADGTEFWVLPISKMPEEMILRRVSLSAQDRQHYLRGTQHGRKDEE
jgi:hypothetical protein